MLCLNSAFRVQTFSGYKLGNKLLLTRKWLFCLVFSFLKHDYVTLNSENLKIGIFDAFIYFYEAFKIQLSRLNGFQL